MTTVIALIFAAGVGSILLWMLYLVGRLFFRRSVHPVLLGVFLLLVGCSMTVVWLTYSTIQRPGGWRGIADAPLVQRVARLVGL